MIRGAGFRASIERIPPPKHLRAASSAQSRLEPRYLVRATLGSGKRALYFHGHYDVVPASSAAQFQPRERNGNIFGRGSADMKGGLVAMLYAARVLKELRVPLAGRIELAFVPDEETGGERGTSALFESGALAPDAIGMLTAEPTSGAIWNASRGAITMRVTVIGKTAHVGLSFRGVNAFERMLAVARALENESGASPRAKQNSASSPPPRAAPSFCSAGAPKAARISTRSPPNVPSLLTGASIRKKISRRKKIVCSRF